MLGPRDEEDTKVRLALDVPNLILMTLRILVHIPVRDTSRRSLKYHERKGSQCPRSYEVGNYRITMWIIYY